MAEVRVLMGTQEGAFLITSDGARRDWKIEGSHFGGWEVMHDQGSPADPDRLYASEWTDWHGQVVQRSDGGGLSRLLRHLFRHDERAGLRLSGRRRRAFIRFLRVRARPLA